MPFLLRRERRGGGHRPAGLFQRRLATALLVLPLVLGGCSVTLDPKEIGETIGGRTLPAGRPHPELWEDPDRWVLIENPYYEPEDPTLRHEPQYVWADKTRLPLTVNRVAGGIEMLLAPPEAQARYAGDKVRPASPPR